MRIIHIDGVRGVASMLVLFSHLIAAFYPILHPLPQVMPMTIEKLAHQSLLSRLIISTPITLFYNGFFAVMVFLIISGYVISNSCAINKDEKHISSSVFRRYFRLTIPIMVACLFSYFLLKLDLFSSAQAAYLSKSPWFSRWHIACDADLFKMLKFVFYDEYFGNPSACLNCYNGPLWIMNFLLIGSFGVYAFYAIFGNANRSFRIFLYIVLIIIFHKSLCLAIVLGMILFEMDVNNIAQNNNKFILIVIFLAGIYLSSFTRYDLHLYSSLNIDFIKNLFDNPIKVIFFYNILGAFLLFFAILRSSFLKKLFSGRVFLYLAKLSFSIYLLHYALICSFSSYVYIWLRNDIKISYNLSFLITSASTIIVLIPLSDVFYKYIEKKVLIFSKSLYDYIDRKK